MDDDTLITIIKNRDILEFKGDSGRRGPPKDSNAPLSCDVNYDDDAPDDAPTYEGPRGGEFFCNNYRDINEQRTRVFGDNIDALGFSDNSTATKVDEDTLLNTGEIVIVETNRGTAAGIVTNRKENTISVRPTNGKKGAKADFHIDDVLYSVDEPNGKQSIPEFDFVASDYDIRRSEIKEEFGISDNITLDPEPVDNSCYIVEKEGIGNIAGFYDESRDLFVTLDPDVQNTDSYGYRIIENNSNVNVVAGVQNDDLNLVNQDIFNVDSNNSSSTVSTSLNSLDTGDRVAADVTGEGYIQGTITKTGKDSDFVGFRIFNTSGDDRFRTYNKDNIESIGEIVGGSSIGTENSSITFTGDAEITYTDGDPVDSGNAVIWNTEAEQISGIKIDNGILFNPFGHSSVSKENKSDGDNEEKWYISINGEDEELDEDEYGRPVLPDDIGSSRAIIDDVETDDVVSIPPQEWDEEEAMKRVGAQPTDKESARKLAKDYDDKVSTSFEGGWYEYIRGFLERASNASSQRDTILDSTFNVVSLYEELVKDFSYDWDEADSTMKRRMEKFEHIERSAGKAFEEQSQETVGPVDVYPHRDDQQKLTSTGFSLGYKAPTDNMFDAFREGMVDYVENETDLQDANEVVDKAESTFSSYKGRPKSPEAIPVHLAAQNVLDTDVSNAEYFDGAEDSYIREEGNLPGWAEETNFDSFDSFEEYWEAWFHIHSDDPEEDLERLLDIVDQDQDLQNGEEMINFNPDVAELLIDDLDEKVKATEKAMEYQRQVLKDTFGDTIPSWRAMGGEQRIDEFNEKLDSDSTHIEYEHSVPTSWTTSPQKALYLAHNKSGSKDSDFYRGYVLIRDDVDVDDALAYSNITESLDANGHSELLVGRQEGEPRQIHRDNIITGVAPNLVVSSNISVLDQAFQLPDEPGLAPEALTSAVEGVGVVGMSSFYDEYGEDLHDIPFSELRDVDRFGPTTAVKTKRALEDNPDIVDFSSEPEWVDLDEAVSIPPGPMDSMMENGIYTIDDMHKIEEEDSEITDKLMQRKYSAAKKYVWGWGRGLRNEDEYNEEDYHPAINNLYNQIHLLTNRQAEELNSYVESIPNDVDIDKSLFENLDKLAALVNEDIPKRIIEQKKQKQIERLENEKEKKLDEDVSKKRQQIKQNIEEQRENEIKEFKQENHKSAEKLKSERDKEIEQIQSEVNKNIEQIKQNKNKEIQSIIQDKRKEAVEYIRAADQLHDHIDSSDYIEDEKIIQEGDPEEIDFPEEIENQLQGEFMTQNMQLDTIKTLKEDKIKEEQNKINEIKEEYNEKIEIVKNGIDKINEKYDNKIDDIDVDHIKEQIKEEYNKKIENTKEKYNQRKQNAEERRSVAENEVDWDMTDYIQEYFSLDPRTITAIEKAIRNGDTNPIQEAINHFDKLRDELENNEDSIENYREYEEMNTVDYLRGPVENIMDDDDAAPVPNHTLVDEAAWALDGITGSRKTNKIKKQNKNVVKVESNPGTDFSLHENLRMIQNGDLPIRGSFNSAPSLQEIRNLEDIDVNLDLAKSKEAGVEILQNQDLQKWRMYVDYAHDIPDWADRQEGPRGGVYYEVQDQELINELLQQPYHEVDNPEEFEEITIGEDGPRQSELGEFGEEEDRQSTLDEYSIPQKGAHLIQRSEEKEQEYWRVYVDNEEEAPEWATVSGPSPEGNLYYIVFDEDLFAELIEEPQHEVSDYDLSGYLSNYEGENVEELDKDSLVIKRKFRVYVDSEGEVPDWARAYEGKEGGIFYVIYNKKLFDTVMNSPKHEIPNDFNLQNYMYGGPSYDEEDVPGGNGDDNNDGDGEEDGEQKSNSPDVTVISIDNDNNVSKRKIYVDSPSEAPDGKEVQQGSNDGYYYIADSSSVEEPDEDKDIEEIEEFEKKLKKGLQGDELTKINCSEFYNNIDKVTDGDLLEDVYKKETRKAVKNEIEQWTGQLNRTFEFDYKSHGPENSNEIQIFGQVASLTDGEVDVDELTGREKKAVEYWNELKDKAEKSDEKVNKESRSEFRSIIEDVEDDVVLQYLWEAGLGDFEDLNTHISDVLFDRGYSVRTETIPGILRRLDLKYDYPIQSTPGKIADLIETGEILSRTKQKEVEELLKDVDNADFLNDVKFATIERGLNKDSTIIQSINDRISEIDCKPVERFNIRYGLYQDIISRPAGLSGEGQGIDKQAWDQVWENINTGDLEEFARAAENRNNEAHSEVAKSMLTYRKDNDMTARDIVDIQFDGGHMAEQELYSELERILSQLDPVIGSFLLFKLSKIKSERMSSNKEGYALYRGICSVDGRNTGNTAEIRGILGHLTGHILHEIVGLDTENKDELNDMSDEIGEGWEYPIMQPKNEQNDFVQEFYERMRKEWKRYTSGDANECRIYQRVSPSEFMAVTFSMWLTDRQKLKIVNKDVNKLYNDMLGKE